MKAVLRHHIIGPLVSVATTFCLSLKSHYLVKISRSVIEKLVSSDRFASSNDEEK